MTSTLDADLDDPTPIYDTAARALLRSANADRAEYLRRQAAEMIEAAAGLRRRADQLDPPQALFEHLHHGDQVWLEDQWCRVLELVTTTDEDGQHRHVVVREAATLVQAKFVHDVTPGETFTRWAA